MNKNTNLQAALKAVREAIQAKQAQIDAETDQVKKSELVAEMMQLTAELGLVFDGDSVAAKAAVDKSEDKPGFFARTKAWLGEKVEVVKNNKGKTAAAVAAVAAVVAGAVYASRNPAAVETVTGLMKKGFTENGEETAATTEAATSSIFARVGDVLGRAVGYVTGAIVSAKDWIVGLFKKAPTTTVSIDIDAEAPAAI